MRNPHPKQARERRIEGRATVGPCPALALCRHARNKSGHDVVGESRGRAEQVRGDNGGAESVSLAGAEAGRVLCHPPQDR